jgi:hypothetical protein
VNVLAASTTGLIVIVVSIAAGVALVVYLLRIEDRVEAEERDSPPEPGER